MWLVAAWATGHGPRTAQSWFLAWLCSEVQTAATASSVAAQRQSCLCSQASGREWWGGRDTIALRSLIAAPAAGGPVLLLPPARCAA